MLELYSTSQIQFCHIGLPSIMRHFLVNNLHFITYSNCIVWPHWKNLHILLILSFPPNSPTFDFFYELKSLEATLDLTQCMWIPCKTTCILSRISLKKGKVQISNNQSKSPLWNIIHFSCSMYFHLIKIAISLVRVYWNYISEVTVDE